MARVRNEFLVFKEKAWYHLEMTKLVFKGSGEAGPTTTGSLCLPFPPQPPRACPPPRRWGLAAGHPLSALRSTHFKLIWQLPCKSLPFLPLWALSPHICKTKDVQKTQLPRQPLLEPEGKLGTHPVAENTVTQTTSPHAVWNPRDCPLPLYLTFFPFY